MKNTERTESLLISAEETLRKYEAALKINPTSLFNKGMVKNTRQRISELRIKLK